MNTDNDEVIKLMVETIKEGMTKYVGKSNNEETREAVKDSMVRVLTALADTANIVAPLPNVAVTINSMERMAVMCFSDPKTNEIIDVSTWLSRAIEGFYD